MGFTRYWKRTDKKITQEFIIAVNNIIADCDEKGIAIRNGFGTGNPVVTMDKVCVNGDCTTGHNLDHETLYIGNEPSDFEFCKTAEKPYDYAVREILKVAEEMRLVTDVSSDDGTYEEIISDEQWIERKG